MKYMQKIHRKVINGVRCCADGYDKINGVFSSKQRMCNVGKFASLSADLLKRGGRMSQKSHYGTYPVSRNSKP